MSQIIPSQDNTIPNGVGATAEPAAPQSALAPSIDATQQHAAPAQEKQVASGIQVKAGPMLKYDTTVDGIYHSFGLIVTEDATSDYSSPPTVSWSAATVQSGSGQTSKAVKLWHYDGQGGPHTFWRFEFNIPMAEGSTETAVQYQVSPGQVAPKKDQRADSVDPTQSYTFFVPGKKQNFRWAGHSCNGFSSGTNTEEWNGSNPLWDDMARHHEQQRFHMVNGGGDQIYCDKLAKEPELKEWTGQSNSKTRSEMPLTEEIRSGIERFFFSWYCEWFGTGTFSKVIAQIPMTNMLDDHDLIDGFGTYDDHWMMSPIFNNIGTRGYFYYLLFQQFLVDEFDGLDESRHSNKSIILTDEKAAYMQEGVRNHSFLTYLGPTQYMLMVDCRSERKVDQIVARNTYERIFKRVRTLPEGVEHLVILLGVPLACEFLSFTALAARSRGSLVDENVPLSMADPRMVFLEKTLGSSFNPLVMLAKGISPGFTNNFNGQVELLDDLGDHWCAGPHKRERNWLVEKLQEIAYEKRVRISFISGDVHATGCGVFFGYHQHDPSTDPKYMLAVITSAIVNAPPPPPVINLLNMTKIYSHFVLQGLRS